VSGAHFRPETSRLLPSRKCDKSRLGRSRALPNNGLRNRLEEGWIDRVQFHLLFRIGIEWGQNESAAFID
jgi:hypothetical protein